MFQELHQAKNLNQCFLQGSTVYWLPSKEEETLPGQHFHSSLMPIQVGYVMLYHRLMSTSSHLHLKQSPIKEKSKMNLRHQLFIRVSSHIFDEQIGGPFHETTAKLTTPKLYFFYLNHGQNTSRKIFEKNDACLHTLCSRNLHERTMTTQWGIKK